MHGQTQNFVNNWLPTSGLTGSVLFRPHRFSIRELAPNDPRESSIVLVSKALRCERRRGPWPAGTRRWSEWGLGPPEVERWLEALAAVRAV